MNKQWMFRENAWWFRGFTRAVTNHGATVPGLPSHRHQSRVRSRPDQCVEGYSDRFSLQAAHMRSLIRDLLVAGRIETGTPSVNPQPAALTGLVGQVRSRFLSGGGRCPTIEIDLPPELPRVLADRRRIVQVLGKRGTRAGAPRIRAGRGHLQGTGRSARGSHLGPQ